MEKKFDGRRDKFIGLFEELKLLDPSWVYDSVSARAKMGVERQYVSRWGGLGLNVATTCPKASEDRLSGSESESEYECGSGASTPVRLR